MNEICGGNNGDPLSRKSWLPNELLVIGEEFGNTAPGKLRVYRHLGGVKRPGGGHFNALYFFLCF